MRVRRNEGSALLVTTVMIVVTVSMIGLILAAPNAQLNRVASATAKEKSLLVADAGLRDAITWLVANQSNLSAWLTLSGSDPVNVFVSENGTGTGIGTAATGLNPTPASASTLKGRVVTASSITPANWWTRSRMPDGFFTTDNYRSFGDPVAGRSRFAYVITPKSNGYFRIDIEGQALSSQGTATNAGTRMTTTKIVAYVNKSGGGNFPISAMTFANPGGQAFIDKSTGANVASPTLRWNTTGNPAVPQISGMDLDTTTNGVGAVFQDGPSDVRLEYNEDGQGANKNVLAGTNSTTGAANATNDSTVSRPADGLSVIDELVAKIEATANGTDLGNGMTLNKYYLNHSSNASNPAGYTRLNNDTSIVLNQDLSGVYYFKIPPAGSWGPDEVKTTKPFMSWNGNKQFKGIIVIDVGDNAFLDNDEPFFHTNGNPGAMQGTFIFYQRGKIKVETNPNIRFLRANGRGAMQLQYSSNYVNKAIQGLALAGGGYKIAVYVVAE